MEDVYIKNAIGYFNNLRVPAAVLMSIIMKEMFNMQAEPNNCMKRWDQEHGVHRSKGWRTVRYALHVNSTRQTIDVICANDRDFDSIPGIPTYC